MEIIISVNRKKGQKEWTLSEFNCDALKIKGVGVEDEFRAVKVKGETRIPSGQYQLALTPSPKFSKEYWRDDEGNLLKASDRLTANDVIKTKFHTQHEAITVLNVPNFDRILWHWGNDDIDTDGCYIVGSVFGKSKNGRDGVANSRKKYTEIYPIIFHAIKNGKTFVNYIDHE
jgi:hypothetical protein